uniref:DUF2911 domain-containing protein n=1 Tax=Roseihalotalea indica TaxID=2867963 RepID=A0AA49GMZ1_9BACT|nr:DUF2911 domain-containing protein [Tunicatimonas sp. TK19036]
MKRALYFTLCLLIVTLTASVAQDFRGLDQSPLDVAYYPDNFAHDRKAGEKAVIKVVYSRPQMKGRTIFGDKVPYGEVWRTGANEATEVKFYEDVTIDGKSLAAGTYALFSIPDEDEWTIIFSSDLDYWGAYSYKEGNDVLRVTAPVTSLDNPVEAFTIQFTESDQQAVMQLAWEKTMARLPITVSK